MFCVKCGATLPDGAIFCPGCGKRIRRIAPNNGEIKTVQFRCKGCGHVMEIDPDSPVLRCSVCGSNELIQEDTDVTIERIRSRVKREENQIYRDVQTGWQRVREKEIDADNKEAAYKREKDEIRSYRRGSMFYLTILLAVFFTLMVVMALEKKQLVPSIIAVLQVILCLLSILMGLRTIRERGRGLRTVLVILSIALFFPYMSFSMSADKAQKKNEIKEKKIIWPAHEMAQTVPEPFSNNGEIDVNNDSHFDFTLYYLTKEDFMAYTQACIDNGYTVDGEWVTDDYYTAYNTDGYYLSVNFIELDPTRTSIDISAPIEMKEVVWPDTDMVNLLPRPESTIGSIETNRETYFSVYIGDTTKEQYSQYVDACITAGFDKDYWRGDESFYADHKKGYHLRVDYRGFNTVRMTIEDKSE